MNISISKLAKFMAKKKDGKIAVVVGTVTDDKRQYDVPKLSVCALRFTETIGANGSSQLRFVAMFVRFCSGTPAFVCFGVDQRCLGIFRQWSFDDCVCSGSRF